MIKLFIRIWSAWDLTSMATATAREAKKKLFNRKAAQKKKLYERTMPKAAPSIRITLPARTARVIPASTSPSTYAILLIGAV